MTPISDLQWEAYRLYHTDYENLSLEETAEKMGVTVGHVEEMLEPLICMGLFLDISGSGRRPAHKTARYGSWCEDQIIGKF